MIKKLAIGRRVASDNSFCGYLVKIFSAMQVKY